MSLRIKDQAHFALNQPSNGSYELKPGLAGYPSTTGATVYEATNGDAAPRLSTTVTVSPRPTPTPTPAPAPNRAPTVSVTGSGTCHPRPGAPCTVTLTANATDPDGDGLTYSWSGCTSGSGASAACSVAGLSTYTGTVVVSDGRGSTATASGTATGTNLGVDSGSGTWCTDGGCGVSSVSVGQVAVYQNPFNARDDAGYCTCVAVVSGTCTGLGPSCASGSEINQAVYATGNGTCNLTVTVTDPWGQHSDVSAWLTVTP